MASTYSSSLKLTLIGDGDQSGIWGQTTNTNLGTLLEQAITGVQSIVMSDANYTLTSFNGVSDEARNAVLVVTGTNSVVRDLIPPVVKKLYVVYNNTTGGNAIRVIGTTGTGVNVPNGTYSLIYCDGTNFVQISNSNNISGALAVSGATTLSGALNGTTATFSGAISSVSPSFTGTPIAPTATVNTNTTQIATTAFVRSIIPSGIISMWSGSIGSIPSGWLLCDGTNGTPDLRDRFIIGAGSTYAVNTTGGSANAIVVSHTHSFTTGTAGEHNHNAISGGPGGGNLRGFGESGGNGFIGYDQASTYYNTGNSGSQLISNAGNHTHTGTTDSAGSSGTDANLPPYYALAYIMKA